MTKKDRSQIDDLSLSQQNYVEIIAELIEKHGHAHTSEIAKLLNVKKPSVTEAVSRLVKLGITRRLDQEIMLTRQGTAIAQNLAHRHESLRRFMIDILETDSLKADEAACRIEHSASSEFIKGLLLLEEFIQLKTTVGFKKRWRQFIRKQKNLKR
ncbi:metal-dependent transcriptional regulator [Verrucomicrobiota bacterium]